MFVNLGHANAQYKNDANEMQHLFSVVEAFEPKQPT